MMAPPPVHLPPATEILSHSAKVAHLEESGFTSILNTGVPLGLTGQ